MLPKKKRMRTEDFSDLRGARVFSSPHFLLRVKKTEEPVRVAVVVSKHIAKNATDRNLFRRRVFSVVRKIRMPSLSHGVLVIQAKKGATTLPFRLLEQEVTQLLRVL